MLADEVGSVVCCKWACSLPACCVQAGAELVEQFAAEKAAGWSIEREEYVMQCTGCADRTAAADALKVANGNVDTVCHLRLITPPPRLYTSHVPNRISAGAAGAPHIYD